MHDNKKQQVAAVDTLVKNTHTHTHKILTKFTGTFSRRFQHQQFVLQYCQYMVIMLSSASTSKQPSKFFFMISLEGDQDGSYPQNEPSWVLFWIQVVDHTSTGRAQVWYSLLYCQLHNIMYPPKDVQQSCFNAEIDKRYSRDQRMFGVLFRLPPRDPRDWDSWRMYHHVPDDSS